MQSVYLNSKMPKLCLIKHYSLFLRIENVSSAGISEPENLALINLQAMTCRVQPYAEVNNVLPWRAIYLEYEIHSD